MLPGAPGGVFCGGGNTEARFSAFLDIDISGSTFVFLNHVSFTSVNGGFKAGIKNGLPSKITSDSNLFVTVHTTIDVTDAIWDIGGSLKLTTDCAGVAPGAVCIDAKRADMSSQGNMQFTAANNNGIIDLCGGTFEKVGSRIPQVQRRDLSGDLSSGYRQVHHHTVRSGPRRRHRRHRNPVADLIA